MRSREKFRRCAPLVGLLYVLLLDPAIVTSAPVTVEESVYEVEGGCYYMLDLYKDGEQIRTNEPCLNCTCADSMLMCYLKTCPFSKPIGSECSVERVAGQCCPIIKCPEVPVMIPEIPFMPIGKPETTAVVQVTSTTAVSIPEPEDGCFVEGIFFAEGNQVPQHSDDPCDLCYCIHNHTACVKQRCTLEIPGCLPKYKAGTCCPVSYDCDSSVTFEPPTTTTTLPPSGCYVDDEYFYDGSVIHTGGPCEHCYCMQGKLVCAVQECDPPMEKCTPIFGEDHCCPTKYECPVTTAPEFNTTESYFDVSTIAPVGVDSTGNPESTLAPGHGVKIIPHEDQTHTTKQVPVYESSTESYLDNEVTDAHPTPAIAQEPNFTELPSEVREGDSTDFVTGATTKPTDGPSVNLHKVTEEQVVDATVETKPEASIWDEATTVSSGQTSSKPSDFGSSELDGLATDSPIDDISPAVDLPSASTKPDADDEAVQLEELATTSKSSIQQDEILTTVPVPALDEVATDSAGSDASHDEVTAATVETYKNKTREESQENSTKQDSTPDLKDTATESLFASELSKTVQTLLDEERDDFPTSTPEIDSDGTESQTVEDESAENNQTLPISQEDSTEDPAEEASQPTREIADSVIPSVAPSLETVKPSESPVYDHEPSEAPESSEPPKEQPRPTEQPLDNAKQTEQSAEQYKPTEHPAEEPSPSERPSEEPVKSELPTEPPSEKTVPSENSLNVSVQTEQSEEETTPTIPSSELYKPTEPPSVEYKPTELPSEQPRATEQPTEEHKPTAQQSSEEYTPSERPPEELKPTTQSSEEYKPSEQPSEYKPASQPASEKPNRIEESSEAYEPTEQTSEESKQTDESSKVDKPTEQSIEEPKQTEDSLEVYKPTEQPSEEHSPSKKPLYEAKPTEQPLDKSDQTDKSSDVPTFTGQPLDELPMGDQPSESSGSSDETTEQPEEKHEPSKRPEKPVEDQPSKIPVKKPHAPTEEPSEATIEYQDPTRAAETVTHAAEHDRPLNGSLGGESKEDTEENGLNQPDVSASGLTPAVTEAPVQDTATQGDDAVFVAESVPGEGDCNYLDITYHSGQPMPRNDVCNENCTCLNSIVKCDKIVCEIPAVLRNLSCVEVHEDGHCCPRYVCSASSEKDKIPPSSDSQVTAVPLVTSKQPDGDEETTTSQPIFPQSDAQPATEPHLSESTKAEVRTEATVPKDAEAVSTTARVDAIEDDYATAVPVHQFDQTHDQTTEVPAERDPAYVTTGLPHGAADEATASILVESKLSSTAKPAEDVTNSVPVADDSTKSPPVTIEQQSDKDSTLAPDVVHDAASTTLLPVNEDVPAEKTEAPTSPVKEEAATVKEGVFSEKPKATTAEVSQNEKFVTTEAPANIDTQDEVSSPGEAAEEKERTGTIALPKASTQLPSVYDQEDTKHVSEVSTLLPIDGPKPGDQGDSATEGSEEPLEQTTVYDIEGEYHRATTHLSVSVQVENSTKTPEIGSSELQNATQKPKIDATQQPQQDATQQPQQDATQQPLQDLTQQPLQDATQQPQQDATQPPQQDATQQPQQDPTQQPQQDATQQPQQDVTQQAQQDATQKPQQDATQQPQQDVAQQPQQDATQQPQQDATQLPQQDATQQPQQDATQQPQQDATQQPEQDATQQPQQDVTQQPQQDVTQQAQQDATQQPEQDATQQPQQDVTQQPQQAATQQSQQDATQQSQQDATQQSLQDATQQPQKDATQQPQKDATQQPQQDATPQPQQDATQQPQQDATQQPLQDATQQPQQEATQQTLQNATQQPQQDVTQQPQQDATQQPQQVATQQSQQDVTQQPSQDATQQPQQDATQQPLLEATQQTQQNATQQPQQDATQQPLQDATQQPLQDATQQPQQDATQQSQQDATQPPLQDATQQPQQDATQQPELDATQQSQKDATQQPQFARTQPPQEAATQQPQQDATQQPQQDETQKPQEDATQQPQYERTQSPQEDATQQPQQDVTQQPQQEATQQPQQDVTQQSHADVTNHPSEDQTRQPQQDVTHQSQPEATQKPIYDSTHSLQDDVTKSVSHAEPESKTEASTTKEPHSDTQESTPAISPVTIHKTSPVVLQDPQETTPGALFSDVQQTTPVVPEVNEKITTPAVERDGAYEITPELPHVVAHETTPAVPDLVSYETTAAVPHIVSHESTSAVLQSDSYETTPEAKKTTVPPEVATVTTQKPQQEDLAKTEPLPAAMTTAAPDVTLFQLLTTTVSVPQVTDILTTSTVSPLAPQHPSITQKIGEVTDEPLQHPKNDTKDQEKVSSPSSTPTTELPTVAHVPTTTEAHSSGHLPEEELPEVGIPITEANFTLEEGECIYDSRIYASAQQIPRDDPCDFCFCFRGDIICLQQSCPPPIDGCHEEAIPGFCCPRYECPVTAVTLNVTDTKVPYPVSASRFRTVRALTQSQVIVCEFRHKFYDRGEFIAAASGPCMDCICGEKGAMKCIPKKCQLSPFWQSLPGFKKMGKPGATREGRNQF